MKNATIILAILGILLSGGYSKSSIYSGLMANDIYDIEVSELQFLNEYKGSADNWAANLITLQKIGDENHKRQLVFKYIGDDTKPVGKIKYSYDTTAGSGRGTTPANKKAEDVYFVGYLISNGAIPQADSSVSFRVEWNGQTEEFDLKVR
ncbi:hypothetical protein [Paenibacillus illinoisensis]|uniref:hypothetical protein n=1 Tax=Paenibacillus illinoisensis TaxID=59845 RepID=UPI003D2AF47D